MSTLFSFYGGLAMFNLDCDSHPAPQCGPGRVVQSVVIIPFAIIYTVIVSRTLKPGDPSSFGSLEA